MIRSYFQMIGWPSTLPTSDYPVFCRKIHDRKQAIFKQLLAEGRVPLREGVVDILRAARASNTAVGVIAGTASSPEEGVAEAMCGALAEELQLDDVDFPIFFPGRWSAELDGVMEDGSTSGSEGGGNLEEQMRRRAADAKRALRESSARVLSNVGAVAAEAGTAQQLTPEYLAACAAVLGRSAAGCVYLGASSGGLEAAKSIGMFAAAIPSKFMSNMEYRSVDAKFMGLQPGGGATWTKLKAIMESEGRW